MTQSRFTLGNVIADDIVYVNLLHNICYRVTFIAGCFEFKKTSCSFKPMPLMETLISHDALDKRTSLSFHNTWITFIVNKDYIMDVSPDD